MKKRFSPKQLLPSKKIIMAIAAAACVTAFSIGGVHYYNTNLKETATTATYYNQYLAASGADEVITDQVKDYISNYFQTMNVKEFISQDEMAQIIAQISTGVMNRLPTDTLSSGQELKVKEMISKAVIEAANDNNNQATDNTGADATVITEELQSYIKTTIVPNITAEIQINQGAIDDLKKSLADLSEKYKENQKEYDALIDSIGSKLGKLDKNGATNDDVANLKKDLEKLSKVLGDYKSSSSSDVTDVSKELEAAKKDLQSKIDKYTEVSDGSLFPDWVELPQNWILSIPIAYKIDVGGDIRTTTENIIVTCQNNNISLTGGYSAGGKAAYSWTARGYSYTSNSYFSIGQPTISYNGQTPKDFNISIRINSQIYDYSDWDGYGGGFVTDKGNATNQDVSVYCRSGVITYSPTVEIHTSSYGSSTTNDGHTLMNEFHLNSMTLILKEFL